jgi:hypothetical protein
MPAQRNRTVIFRVSQDEYDRLKNAVQESGSRSVSDYARTELLKSADGGNLDFAVHRGLGEMNQKVSELRTLMENLVARHTGGDQES